MWQHGAVPHHRKAFDGVQEAAKTALKGCNTPRFILEGLLSIPNDGTSIQRIEHVAGTAKMSSFIGGFQLPFQKRLSRLYNDTKKSSDFVKEPVQNAEDPDVKALHRKLRIQKDRLVSWGIEWSDPKTNASAEIDESLSQAGLSELVGSIMSTIKDILAEAEPLWQSYKGRPEGGGSKGDMKVPLMKWDKGRFEDLVSDLTASIDTLFDLTRTRSSQAPRTSTFTKSVDDLKPFESSRMQTPQQIDAKSLEYLGSSAGETAATRTSNKRDVVIMSKQAYADLNRSGDRGPWAPLLLEFAPFDPIYSTTGIMPPMVRFEKLSAGLQREPQRSPGTWSGLPRLLAFFEDMEHSRLGLVYQFPQGFEAVTRRGSPQNAASNLCTLGDALSRPDFEPRLEAKFRLAHNLANTIFDMHARGIAHGNLVNSNVEFCAVSGEPDIRRPLVASFEVFPETPAQDGTPDWVRAVYQHPLDPRVTPQSPLAGRSDLRVLDLYSLAMILLEVGLWTRIENCVPGPNMPSVSESVLDQLAIRCGTLYMKAVEACWRAVDDELAGKAAGDALLSAVQVQVSRYLEACCIIDGVIELEGRARDEAPRNAPSLKTMPGLATSSSMDHLPVSKFKQASDQIRSRSAEPPDSTKEKTSSPVVQTQAAVEPGMLSPPVLSSPLTVATDTKPQRAEKEKLRLYPQVPLPPEAVEKWNTVLMPRINLALRQFYRKHPESVEISLESIGTTPHTTKPTVLVVCTSVSKVRTILSRKVADLFDTKSSFALKVCKGKVLRARKDSRKQMPAAARSMAGPKSSDDESHAENCHFQKQPSNGASIGAWNGYEHLPPVSFGGLVVVNNKPYGMTVHHMLDDPDMVHGPSKEPLRSAKHDNDGAGEEEDGDEDESYESSGPDEDFACEFSDDEDYSETELTSDYEEEDDDDDDNDDDDVESDGAIAEDGDVPGVEPGCGEAWIVTQPALDDVEEGFYPEPEMEDEEHLLSFRLGEVYASSGIRRRCEGPYIHEIDWALFEFQTDRRPKNNNIPHVVHNLANPIHPTDVASADSLPNMEVQCMARTSGLQTGKILPALTSVKIKGRTSPSHSYQVTSLTSLSDGDGTSTRACLGVPGDSGAWIIDRQQGRVCGHVLAFSKRKRVAYICPMEVLMRDIAETLGAGAEIKLPGGVPVSASAATAKGRVRDDGDSAYSDHEGDHDDAPVPTRQSQLHGGEEGRDVQGFLTEKMEELDVTNGKRIRVHV
jgi:hypothetical protein